MMRVVFMGTPEFAVRPLEYLVLNGYQVAAVYTRRDRPAGRGRALAPSPVKRAATRLGLTVVQPESLNRPESTAELAGFNPEAIVVCAYGQILRRAVLDLPPLGCVNVHPSLLPRHRGAAPIPAALLAGDEYTGVSIMLMDEGLDTGPVLAQAKIPIAPRDNAATLGLKLSWLSARLLCDALVFWRRRDIVPRPQDEAEATFSRPIAKEEGAIDWRLPAEEIWRRVRAFNPWPGAYTAWAGRRLKLLAAEPVPSLGECQPGKVIALGAAQTFGVCCGSGVLEVAEVQLEGKRPVSGAEFLRGQRGFIGASLPG